MECKNCAQLTILINKLLVEREQLKEECDGCWNGHAQLQAECNDLQDTIKKYADERKDLIGKLAIMKEEYAKLEDELIVLNIRSVKKGREA